MTLLPSLYHSNPIALGLSLSYLASFAYADPIAQALAEAEALPFADAFAIPVPAETYNNIAGGLDYYGDSTSSTVDSGDDVTETDGATIATTTATKKKTNADTTSTASSTAAIIVVSGSASNGDEITDDSQGTVTVTADNTVVVTETANSDDGTTTVLYTPDQIVTVTAEVSSGASVTTVTASSDSTKTKTVWVNAHGGNNVVTKTISASSQTTKTVYVVNGSVDSDDSEDVTSTQEDDSSSTQEDDSSSTQEDDDSSTSSDEKETVTSTVSPHLFTTTITPTVTLSNSDGTAQVTRQVITTTIALAGVESSTTRDPSTCGAAWEQCGGLDYSGATCCQAGMTCGSYNSYWARCVPTTTLASVIVTTISGDDGVSTVTETVGGDNSGSGATNTPFIVVSAGSTTTVTPTAVIGATASTVVVDGTSSVITINRSFTSSRETTVTQTVYSLTTIEATVTALVTSGGSTYQSVITTQRVSGIAKGISTYVTTAAVTNGAYANKPFGAVMAGLDGSNWKLKAIVGGIFGLGLLVGNL